MPDKTCFFCGDETSEYAGDPFSWPLVFCHPDGTGIPHTHCTGCVVNRVFDTHNSVRLRDDFLVSKGLFSEFVDGLPHATTTPKAGDRARD